MRKYLAWGLILLICALAAPAWYMYLKDLDENIEDNLALGLVLLLGVCFFIEMAKELKKEKLEYEERSNNKKPLGLGWVLFCVFLLALKHWSFYLRDKKFFLLYFGVIMLGYSLKKLLDYLGARREEERQGSKPR